MEGVDYVFGIFERAQGALVGRIAITGAVRGTFENASLGYFVDEAHGGRGFATEAVCLTAGFAWDGARLRRLQAAVLPDNVRSTRVLHKAGFRREGLARRYLFLEGAWRDHVIYAASCPPE